MFNKLDPVRLEILWSKLITIAEEISTVLLRTSFSSIIRECRDFACGVFNTEGDLLAQSTRSTPGLIGVMPLGLKNILKVFPKETIKPGDILVTNDPWLLSGHLPDITIVTPVFKESKLFAFIGNIAHHFDIGGRMGNPESREIFEEGLRIPVSKIYTSGIQNNDIFNFIRDNVRSSEKVIGDVRAQIAANNIGCSRLTEFMNENNLETLVDLGSEIISRTEASTRGAIEKIPDGKYPYQAFIDSDTKPIKINLVVFVQGSDIIVDYKGTSPQVDRAINSPFNYTYAHTTFGLKCLLDPLIPSNAGYFKPITVKAPEGSILNAKFPAAVVARSQVTMYLSEFILMALSKALPGRVIAGSGSCPLWNKVFDGMRRDGKPFHEYFFIAGGMGARSNKDGVSCLQFPANVDNAPIEIVENEAPVLYERKALFCDSGGAGEYRGGLGQEVSISIHEGVHKVHGKVRFGVKGGRYTIPVPGLFGGRGSTCEIRINDGEPLKIAKYTQLTAGDRICSRTPGGGGYGDPFKRDPKLVEKDVRHGYVSVDGALRCYRVVVNKGTQEVDVEMTKKIRSEKISNNQV